MSGSLLLQLLLIVVLILFNAFFAMSEIAVISTNDSRLRKLAEDGEPGARLLVKMLATPSRFLASIQVGMTIASLLSSAVASESFADKIMHNLAGLPVPPSLLKVLVVAVITLLLSYFTLVFGELVPKRLALHNSEKIALRVAGVLSVVATLFRPFITFLAFSTNLISKPLGVETEDEKTRVTEEEIRMMVDVGEENGTIEEEEKEMINNVFDFNDRIVSEIMTHRTEISAVEITASLEEVLQIALEEGYSRIPVFEDELDNIVGVIYIKDLLKSVGQPIAKTFSIREIMRPPLIVPETKKCRELFNVLTTRKQHMAVIIDEYGGTAGIVTMEDLLEEIVGDIQDEYDHEEAEFSVIDELNYTIDGSAELDEVCERLDIELPEGEYDTIAGFIIDRLGRIPNAGEHPVVEAPGVTFTVEQVEDRRIEKVRATKAPAPADPETDSRNS